MALVPIVCRLMAKLGGEVTTPNIELKCQSWYFAFQVIQVFLVTTFSSGASSVVSEIINDPSSATTLLATSLPKASNFYISYIIVQGLGIAAGNLLNIGALAMLTVVGKFLDKTPRKMFKRYITLAGLGWGSLYPKFANLGVIGKSILQLLLDNTNRVQPSPILPLLLLFSALPLSVSVSFILQPDTTPCTSLPTMLTPRDVPMLVVCNSSWSVFTSLKSALSVSSLSIPLLVHWSS